MADATRDFSSISPSAELLIRLKAYTSIPFAKETAELLIKDIAPDAPLATAAGNPMFFKWLIHFENRYRSIDKIVEGLPATNFLELSSGYSCRSLNLCLQKHIHFTDTDLPELIAEKRKLVNVLLEERGREMKGTLQLFPLNVLDRNEFMMITDLFPPGPLLVINEGLLPYLNKEEKIELCSILREVLQQRGGWWVTGDIYVREEDDPDMPEIAKKWRDKHHIEENKFESFAGAEHFFHEQGFKVIQRESWVIDRLSCLERIGEKKETVIEKLKNKVAERETWCLEVQ